MQLLNDFKSKDFWIALTVAIITFLIGYHLPRILKRNT